MRLAVVALCVASAWAQNPAPLPANFSAAGIAVQNGVTSGWGQACHQAPESSIFGYVVRSMACIASDYRPKGTSARLDLDAVWLHNSRWTAGTKTGVGGAYNSTSSGSSVTLGGWGALRLGTVYIVGSVCWSKDALTQAVGSSPVVFEKVKAATIVRLGLGKSWEK